MAKSEPDSPSRLLARLLETPQLARVVPHLAPEALHQLIQHCGLEACGELVAAATPEQLTSVFDLDLWRHAQPGRDEGFDAARFGEWLELLAETDATVAAQTVAAMDDNLVIAGLSRFVRVFDIATFEPAVSTDDEPTGAASARARGDECEVGGYLVRAIGTEAWDAIVALLMALDADHPDRFHAVMRGCRRLSNSAPEVDGLDELFMAPEQLMHDVALDREHRRSAQGYSTPAQARAFLQMARQRSGHSDDAPAVNPVAAAYFRAATEAAASAEGDEPAPSPRLPGPPPAGDDVAEAVEAVVELFAAAGLVPQRPRALLEGAHPQHSHLTTIRTLMEHVRDRDDTAFLARSHELAFLANTLVAGCSIQSRSFTPQEASDAAVGICNLGLEQWPVPLPSTFLVDHDLVNVFEVGWAVLYQDVCMSVVEQLIATLASLRYADAETQQGLRALRIGLVRQRDAGTPWRARDALDVIAILDTPAWASLLGLMSECPVIPEVLTATLEGRTGAINATAFEFISTTSQIDRIQAFMARLPDMLRP